MSPVSQVKYGGGPITLWIFCSDASVGLHEATTPRRVRGEGVQEPKLEDDQECEKVR